MFKEVEMRGQRNTEEDVFLTSTTQKQWSLKL